MKGCWYIVFGAGDLSAPIYSFDRLIASLKANNGRNVYAFWSRFDDLNNYYGE